MISHSLVGASEEYADSFFEELPKTFKPGRFDPDAWARLAKVSGIRYLVFTTKHHSGFTLYNDRTWPNPVVLEITDARPPDH